MTSRIVPALVLLAVMGGSSGCIKSKLAMDAGVELVGVAEHADGSPYAAAKLGLVKQPDLGEALVDTFFLPASILSCFTNDPVPICQHARLATADSSGHYQFALTGADTQGSVFDADAFNLTLAEPTHLDNGQELRGPNVTENFVIQTTHLALPNLRLWAPTLSVTPDAQTVSLGASLPSGTDYGVQPVQTNLFTDSGGSVVWSMHPDGGAGTDLRLLEDAVTRVHVKVDSTGVKPFEQLRYHFESGEALFSGGTKGAPPSRAKRCFGEGLQGTKELVPCGLTDGSLTTPAFLTGDFCPQDGGTCPELDHWAYIDLGASASVSLIAVRGFSVGEVVELSNDAASWTEASAQGTAYPDSSSGFYAATFGGGGVSTRYIRVRQASASGTLFGLAEISAW